MAKIFVLVGTSQYYEDCDTWVAGAFSSVEAAEARKKAAEARIAEIHQEAYRRDRLPPRSAVILPPLDTTSQYDPRLIYRPVVDYTIVETDLE
jgi:hypothetical protein